MKYEESDYFIKFTFCRIIGTQKTPIPVPIPPQFLTTYKIQYKFSHNTKKRPTPNNIFIV